MSRATERYLRQATRGLTGSTRHAVQAELSSHLHERMRQHQAFGLSEEAAEARVLAELGAPTAVNRGLLQVHAVSWLTSLGMLGLLGVTLILTLPHSQAQVEGPVPSIPELSLQYVEVNSLKAQLQKEGVSVQGPVDHWTLTFPKGKRPVTIYPNLPISGLLPTLYPNTTNHKTYLDANLLIQAAHDAGLSVQLEGWTNPVLHLGSVALQLGTAAAPTDAYNIYARFFGPFVAEVLGHQPDRVYPGNLRWYPSAIRSHYRLNGVGRAGEVYALVTTHKEQGHLVFDFDLAPVDAQGKLSFDLPYGLDHLQLVPSMVAFQHRTGQEEQGMTAAVLLRLTEDGSAGIRSVVQPLHRVLNNLIEE
ncbi:permease prefix domain 1-containing protein [Deinococcus humi]|uniref:Uncharacterized protein n=1 Tax=Deinococcus humi TaxID=662880 RepID=A0A7W8NJ57_9DEIO|nr:permease prefix domain 1-containing protein [Deinococcus humi]MBB5365777.1 hypothetical protein [Deinococcus humi]GGO41082.1 hypothetical protein GCM10008949_51400 [Deinococcus humi]